MYDVSLVPCADYSEAAVRASLAEAIEAIGGLDWVTPGMTVAVKANLVHHADPAKAITTHPAVLAELTRLLTARGAAVIVGDSPSLPFTAPILRKLYADCGLAAVEAAGGQLNRDTSTVEVCFPGARRLHRFTAAAWLTKADAIIDCCKLKTHRYMGMTAAVKNFFGAIPGTMKSEYHFQHASHAQFADMLVDLAEYFAPRLCICDAVEAMEGSGPADGTPRHLGALLAARSCHAMDLICAELIGLAASEVDTLAAAAERGLISGDWRDVSLCGDLDALRAADFEKAPRDGFVFSETGSGLGYRLSRTVMQFAFRAKPVIDSRCSGCGACTAGCPAGAIRLENGRAQLNMHACTRCLDCRELCPTGALTLRRTPLARLTQK